MTETNITVDYPLHWAPEKMVLTFGFKVPMDAVYWKKSPSDLLPSEVNRILHD